VPSLLSAVLLGFVLGLQHATDADHLVAVGTIVTREQRFRDGALVGAFWGLGHMVTLTVAGGALVGLGWALAQPLASGLEFAVAATLVALGVLRLRDATRGYEAVAPEHLIADHAHGHLEALHSHPHDHGGRVHHQHPHVHPSRRLLSALAARRGSRRRALLVGAVHGMAGSAALALLVLTTLHSVWAAVIYLAVFGLGTIAGMTFLTAALAYPLSLACRADRARRVLAVGAGAGSIAFGVVYGLKAL
jgi:high-affinity nickel-transport protein